MYSEEPVNPEAYTSANDAMYSRFGTIYDFFVKHTSVWNAWIGPAIAHIRGPRVLEVSFGTGALLAQYAQRFETYGIDLNRKLVDIASQNITAAGPAIPLQVADVEALPFRRECFDTVVNTMAFSGYPRAELAMAEIHRVLKPGARLVLIDVGPPQDGNRWGRAATWLWSKAGDIIRDMDPLLARYGFTFTHQSIGGFGSVHLYIAQKQ